MRDYDLLDCKDASGKKEKQKLGSEQAGMNCLVHVLDIASVTSRCTIAKTLTKVKVAGVFEKCRAQG